MPETAAVSEKISVCVSVCVYPEKKSPQYLTDVYKIIDRGITVLVMIINKYLCVIHMYYTRGCDE